MTDKQTVALVFVTFGVLVAGGMAGIPKYGVWQKELSGKAQLREAEWSRQIAVQEAKAHKESAYFEAQAESIRAEGVNIANRIIGEGLKDNEEYILYLWVQGLQEDNSKVIYVPTEANLPLLEATRGLEP